MEYFQQIKREPHFKIVCNCNHELLNVFEDPAQHIHIIIYHPSVISGEIIMV